MKQQSCCRICIQNSSSRREMPSWVPRAAKLLRRAEAALVFLLTSPRPVTHAIPTSRQSGVAGAQKLSCLQGGWNFSAAVLPDLYELHITVAVNKLRDANANLGCWLASFHNEE